MKRSITAILAGGAVFGATVAFAATLGVDGNNLAAGSDPSLNDCGSVSVDYDVVWDETNDNFDLTSVHITGAAACNGETVELVLLEDNGNNLGGSTSPKTVSTGAVTFTAGDLTSGIDAGLIDEVALVIYTATPPAP